MLTSALVKNFFLLDFINCKPLFSRLENITFHHVNHRGDAYKPWQKVTYHPVKVYFLSRFVLIAVMKSKLYSYTYIYSTFTYIYFTLQSERVMLIHFIYLERYNDHHYILFRWERLIKSSKKIKLRINRQKSAFLSPRLTLELLLPSATPRAIKYLELTSVTKSRTFLPVNK